MIIVLVPKFVLIERHHHRGEMKILEEQSIFCSLIRLKKETMIKAKNSVLCILLCSYALFGIKRHENICFSQSKESHKADLYYKNPLLKYMLIKYNT